ncbi:MAG TPA: hypothetical protein VJ023_10640 [Pyrinomonadaceae bacterium]|nr:hypothetical protein [Pyrinomonadaceae bacterium]
MGLQILLTNPKIKHPHVAPHKIRAIVRIELKQQQPVISPRLEELQARIVVAGLLGHLRFAKATPAEGERDVFMSDPLPALIQAFLYQSGLQAGLHSTDFA